LCPYYNMKKLKPIWTYLDNGFVGVHKMCFRSSHSYKTMSFVHLTLIKMIPMIKFICTKWLEGFFSSIFAPSKKEAYLN
jgi:hypothetical protein